MTSYSRIIMNLEKISFLPTDNYVKTLGRTFMLEDCRVLSLSGSGVEFKYTGTGLAVTFYGDSTTETPDNDPEPWRDQARVAVYVDGILQLDTVIKKPKEIFEVCGFEEGGAAAEHIVRIIKLSEPRMSTTGLGEITIIADGPAHPTEYKKKYIEFIGDSITCGYGIDVPNELHPFSTGTENVAKAFSYKTAQKLDADFSIVSYSGHGLISGYTPDPNFPKLEELIQPYYDIFAYSYNTFRGLSMQDRKWDFKTERKPDMIIINIGTNDDSYVQDDEAKRNAFKAAYVSFLEKVHDLNPEAKIIIAFGLMGDRLYKTEVEAADIFKVKSGFDDIYTVHITPQDFEKNGYGADYHPSAISHELAACELSEFIKNNF